MVEVQGVVEIPVAHSEEFQTSCVVVELVLRLV